MFLENVKLFNFRNLDNAAVTLAPEVNFVLGKNGQGKTNLVEAINFLSTGRSFRTSSLDELIRWGEKSASVFSKVQPQRSAAGPFEIGLVLDNGTREAYLNGEKLNRLTDFIGKVGSVTFTPTDIALVKGPPSARRRFMDSHLADLDRSLVLPFVNYQKALRHKSSLLKEGAGDHAQLDTWDQMLAESSWAIESARVRFIERLQEKANAFLDWFARSDGALGFALESDLVRAGPLSSEEMFDEFRKKRAREMQYRICLTGPHRDDLSITLNDKDTRAFASQGQSRSVTLALKLAVIELLEADTEESPVILLDDVDAELDQERSKALFDLVIKQARQVFITGTSHTLRALENVTSVHTMEVVQGRVGG